MPPVPQRFNRQLAVTDYAEVTLTSAPAAGGRAEATLEVPDIRLVDRIVVQCTSSTDTTCLVYVGDERPGNLRDGTFAGNLDIADESQPIHVPPGQVLRFVWTGASDGAIGTALVQYRVMVQTGGFG